ncbi:MAG: hypothetical protein U0694_11980 [Anaerolineae bacterium]
MTQTAAIKRRRRKVLLPRVIFFSTGHDWQERYPDGFVHMFEDEVAMVCAAGCFTMGTDPQIDYFLVLTVERPADIMTMKRVRGYKRAILA